jgi:hypothetical protein
MPPSMKKFFLLVALVLAVPAFASADSPPAADPWASIAFLEGTWSASGRSHDGAVVSGGKYTFVRELDRHVMARHDTTDPSCNGPATFDCKHSDLLYIYQDAPGQALQAIYFDNEGHVIHYVVSTPDATTAVFLSAPGPGPRFRLVYQLKDGVMDGKFQIQMPQQTDWTLYLEWSGGKA